MTWADFIVRGTLVLAAGFAASYAFGRASAALRHLVWTSAFVALLALPVAFVLGPKIALDTWPAAPAGSESVNAMAPAHTPAEAGRATQTRSAQPLAARRAPPRDSDWRMATPMGAWAGLALYIAGLLLVTARFVAGAVRTARM